MLPKVLTIGPSQPVNSVSFLEVTYVCAWVVSLGLGLRFRCWWVVGCVPDTEHDWVESGGWYFKAGLSKLVVGARNGGL